MVDTADVCGNVIDEVLALEEADSVDLPPLFDAVDPDALEAIFAPTPKGKQRTGQIRFPYAGYDVFVEFDRELAVTIEPR